MQIRFSAHAKKQLLARGGMELFDVRIERKWIRQNEGVILSAIDVLRKKHGRKHPKLLVPAFTPGGCWVIGPKFGRLTAVTYLNVLTRKVADARRAFRSLKGDALVEHLVTSHLRGDTYDAG